MYFLFPIFSKLKLLLTVCVVTSDNLDTCQLHNFNKFMLLANNIVPLLSTNAMIESYEIDVHFFHSFIYLFIRLSHQLAGIVKHGMSSCGVFEKYSW